MNVTPSNWFPRASLIGVAGALAMGLVSCGGGETEAKNPAIPVSGGVSVGVIKAGRKTLQRQLTVSSELVPFQQIDVYAKVSGYVQKLDVDYGTRVKAGQVMAVLEIPELEVQLRQDDDAIKNAADQVSFAQHEVGRAQAQHTVAHLQFERLDRVAKSKPGLVAQQEVDDAQGKDLAAEAQVEASQSSLQSAQSELVEAQAKKEHDQVLFDYAKITAPFAGVVTQRYANQGTLMQAGTNSSTQAMPLVQLSQDNLFRLVIPVPESYVRYIRIGDPVSVIVASLNRTFPGKVARFSVDVREDTRTMRTEVDVPNTNGSLVPGMFAEATLTLQKSDHALAIPLQALNHEGEQTTVYLVDQANKIQDRKVTLGLQTADDAEVLDGLSDSDMVVVSDRASLKPGQEVRPQMVEPMQYQDDKNE